MLISDCTFLQGTWDLIVEEQVRSVSRSGSQWEELQASWVALHALITAAQRQAAAAEQPQDIVQVPDLSNFLLECWALEGEPELQLEALARYKPASTPSAAWDVRVNEVITQVPTWSPGYTNQCP